MGKHKYNNVEAELFSPGQGVQPSGLGYISGVT